MRRVSPTPLIAAALLVPACAWAGPGRGPDVRALAGGALWLLIGLLAVPPLATLELLLATLAPGPVNAARAAVMNRRPACLLAGFATMVIGLFLAAALGSAGGLGGLLAVLIVAALVGALLLGLPAVATPVGHAVLSLAGRAPNPLASTAWGLVLILVAAVYPVLGWVLFLYLALVGVGGVVLTLARRRPGPPESEAGGAPPEGNLPPA